MSDRPRSDQFDDLVQEVLSGRDATTGDAELRDLARLAAALRTLPRDSFKVRLRAELERSAMSATYIPQGLSSVTPYLIVRDAAAAIDWYTRVFGAEEVDRYTDDAGRVPHAKMRLGDSIVELGEHTDVNRLDPERMPPVGMHLYVEDVDALVDRVAAADGRVIMPVTEQFYGDREATLADPFGIIWFVATYVGGG